MALTDSTKILLLVVLFGIVLYALTKNNSDPIHNEGMLTLNSKPSVHFKDADEVIQDEAPDDTFQKRMKSRNSSKGEYKYSSYSGNKRQSESSSLDKFFEGNHPNDNNGSELTGIIEGDKYAAYLSDGGSKKLSDKEKFDPSALLPKEKNGEWFDDPHESTNIKSTHLINIYRPVGVNTIHTTLKNASHDIRGTPANPKYPVSPWGNSSYEPDTNINNNTLCN